MEEKGFKFRVISSLLWKLFERGGAQGIQFVLQIILARLLMPEDYGIVALIMVFILIANVFIQSGFKMALIQKKNTDETDFSSVLYLSLSLSCLLYMILFFAAPYIALFYEEMQLTPLLRVLSIILFFGAFSSIQNAVIARKLLFKKLFYSSLGAVIVSGILGISLAYSGFGPWALVAQQLTNHFLISVILWFTLRWRPKLLFSLKSLSTLFSYGWKVLVAVMIHTIYENLRSLIIGRIYDASMLGLYKRGMQFPALIVTNINDSILTVIFPVLAMQQDNRQRVKSMLRRSIIITSFLIFPMMLGLAAIAEPLVKFLLTDKWLPAVPFLQIYCFTYAFWPLHTANFSAINALGRSDVTLKLEMLKKSVGFLILFISAFYGIYAIAIGGVVSGFLFTLIDTYPNRKFLNYSYKELWKDIMPSLLLSACMGIIVFSFNYLKLPLMITLLAQISTGLLIYYSMARLFNINSYQYIMATYKEYFYSKKTNNIFQNSISSEQ